MKKTTILVSLITVCAMVFAQAPIELLPQNPSKKSHIECQYPKAKTAISNVQAKKAVIWSETFVAGIPSGWTNAGTPAAAIWEYRGPSTTPTNATGGQGDCSGGVPIASPTTADGFVIFDSNNYDPNSFCGGGNLGTATAPQTSALTTDAIDLSAEAAVQLTFWTEMREFDATSNVNISVDGGSTFTNVWEAGLGTNMSFFGQVTVNITAVAANQADVRIQFEWLNGNYYEWMIDDIEIETPPDNDLVLNDIFFNTTSDAFNQGTRYFKVPYRQAEFDTLKFGAAIENLGGAAQPNTKLTVTVTGQGGYSDATTPMSLAPAIQDSVNILTSEFMPGSGLGTYDVTFNVSSDSVDNTPLDNSRLFSFDVTDTIYARDNDDNPMGWQTQVVPLQARANLFEIWTQDTATSISVTFGGLGDVGSVFSVHLWDTSLAAPISSGFFDTVQTADFGVWKTIDIPDVALAPGIYFAGVEVVTGTSFIEIDNEDPFPLAPLGTYVYNDSTDGTGNGGVWFTAVNNIPFIRLNTKLPSAICAITANAPTVTAVSCPGATDGAVTGIVPTGGTAPYTYSWSPGAGGNADTTGLAVGTYMLVITDASACTYNVVAIITAPTALSLSTTNTNVSACGVCDGSSTLTVSGGTAPYAYLWNDPGAQTNANAVGLCAGIFTCLVTDAAGCTSTASVILSDPGSATGTLTSSAASCAGVCNGSASVTVSGGVTPYVYLWDDPAAQSDSVATGLCGGAVSVVVTDANGCTVSITDSISETSNIALTFTSVADVGSSGIGTATVSATGGTTPYTYLWDDPAAQTTATATGLFAGTYACTVTDANSCVMSGGATVLATSIGEVVSGIQFNIFPNPTDGIITLMIESVTKEDFNVVVQNLIGEILLETNYSGRSSVKEDINLGQLPNGVYFISVESENGSVNKRIVVAR